MELAPQGIRVNSVSPGPISTPIFGKMDLTEEQTKEFLENVKQQVPLGRTGEPAEVAKVMTFLLSGEASYVDGVDWAVDGGMVQV